MNSGKWKYPLLPYELRVRIWDLIHQDYGLEKILDTTFKDAPPGVSQEQFIRCVRALKGRHTLGLKPSKR